VAPRRDVDLRAPRDSAVVIILTPHCTAVDHMLALLATAQNVAKRWARLPFAI
jgi:hypothetical protein